MEISGPQWVRFFIWLGFKQQLLINIERVRRGLGHNMTCKVMLIGNVFLGLSLGAFGRIEISSFFKVHPRVAVTLLRYEASFAEAGGIAHDRNGKWILGLKSTW
ncbi:hypothetical protein PVK06_017870 [Gossypium arboreum]|uniref:Uncharacterized protein n=1 Tax=Gossypium arboreum TaxID=29729 RepID=A0ABR0Q491_GOSAR|nr:hypothetical protein PVK06_017870 [Gossypium arboreum]